ncbi:hypothetical protein Tco_0841787 [Tanacetum coccineum]|uniref:Uncharacterized protein n=1 Tax=Tanacetum coccineum TaxID=301880 RepID=A0ABQ5AXE0_9ASTR
MQLMQLLMGLDECYRSIRSALLTRDPLLKVKDAYTIVSREESHRGTLESSSVTQSKMNVTSFVAKSFNNFKRVRRNSVNEAPEPKKKVIGSVSYGNKLTKPHTISSTLEDPKDKIPSSSALQVLRRLGSIFTSVYAVVQKLKKALAKSTWEDLKLIICPSDVKEKTQTNVKDSELASLFGKLKYKENLIDNIYETENKKSLVSATPLSTAFFSSSIVQDFQDSPDDDEEDTRNNHTTRYGVVLKVVTEMWTEDINHLYNNRGMIKVFVKRLRHEQ